MNRSFELEKHYMRGMVYSIPKRVLEKGDICLSWSIQAPQEFHKQWEELHLYSRRIVDVMGRWQKHLQWRIQRRKQLKKKKK